MGKSKVKSIGTFPEYFVLIFAGDFGASSLASSSPLPAVATVNCITRAILNANRHCELYHKSHTECRNLTSFNTFSLSASTYDMPFIEHLRMRFREISQAAHSCVLLSTHRVSILHFTS